MTQLPHVLKRIRLNLARSKEFPGGSARHGYEFVAPLDAAGRIDPQLWREHREHCGVRRFWQGEPDQVGRPDRQSVPKLRGASQYSSKVQQCPRCPALYSVVRPHSARVSAA